MTPKTLDHVALWVADRDAIAEKAIGELGMHVIERTDRFTLIGADALRFKLTLFVEEGPREPGALKEITLRVSDGDEATVELGEGLTVNVVRTPTEVDYDLDHVALYSVDPEATAEEYLSLGFDEAEARDGVPRVELGGAFVEFHRGEPGVPERPLLNHLAVLVDRADDAKELPAEVADVVDAPNTYAVFVWGPERVKLEYVEHKPTFSLV
ncbi:MAG TPA: VOC family protein [Gaiellaceae bacterium]|nr:VOC family protein [Gaiellaceae bacterium]